MVQAVRQNLKKPSVRLAAQPVDLHAPSEISGGGSTKHFERDVGLGTRPFGPYTHSTVDGLTYASADEISHLGVLGKFENLLNSFFGGHLITQDEALIVGKSFNSNGPELTDVIFSDPSAGPGGPPSEFHRTTFTHTDGEIISAFGATGVLETFANNAGPGLSQNVLQVFFQGNEAVAVNIQEFFSNFGVLRNFQNKLEPELQKLAEALGIQSNIGGSI